MPSLSLILPVHNQADHIEGVVADHLEVLPRVWADDYEVLLVTNGCRDDSVAVCTTLAERVPAVRTLDLEVGSWGRAVRAGLAAAEGDVLCYTNSARTTSEMLALMLAYAHAYPEVVLKANRRIRESLRRRFGSLLYNLEARALFNLAVWDVNGTPKIFPRAYDALVGLERDDDLIDLEFMVACRERGYPVVEVPVLATVRHGGRSTTNYGSALRMYRGALAMRRARGGAP